MAVREVAKEEEEKKSAARGEVGRRKEERRRQGHPIHPYQFVIALLLPAVRAYP